MKVNVLSEILGLQDFLLSRVGMQRKRQMAFEYRILMFKVNRLPQALQITFSLGFRFILPSFLPLLSLSYFLSLIFQRDFKLTVLFLEMLQLSENKPFGQHFYIKVHMVPRAKNLLELCWQSHKVFSSKSSKIYFPSLWVNRNNTVWFASLLVL